MWSSSGALHNGFIKVPPSTELSLDDLDDIDFSLYGDEARPNSDGTESVERKNEMAGIFDVHSSEVRRTCITKVPLHESHSQSVTETKENSLINLTLKSTTSPYIAPRHDHNVRIVEIKRLNKDPLGFFIRQGDGYGRKAGIYISRVTKGSLAESGGLLKVGDEILKINQTEIKGYCLSDVVQLIQIPTRLILTLRSPSLCSGVRPRILSRHSSPCLLAGLGEDSKKQISHQSNYERKTVKELNLEQSDLRGKLNANELVSSDLSTNNSTIDELIELLRPHNQQQSDSKSSLTSPHTNENQLLNDKGENAVDICDVNLKSSDDKLQTKQGFYVGRRASTIMPQTTVDLVFDDEETESAKTSECERVLRNKTYPYHGINITQPQDTTPEKSLNQQTPLKVNLETNDTLQVTNIPARSRSSSRGSSNGSSPKARRRLPSIPTEEEKRQKQSRKDISTNVPPKPIPSIRTNVDGKPRRKLPTPPASPIMDDKRAHYFPHKIDKQRQKTLSWGGPEVCSLAEIESLSSNTNEKDRNNNKSDSETLTSEPASEHTNGANKFNKQKLFDKVQQNECEKTTVYRRSQSQHADIFDQQRHSMFLQSLASGQRNMANSWQPNISGVSGSLSLSLDNSATNETRQDGVQATNDTSSTNRSRDRSPIMRRYASSSLLLNNSKEVSPRGSIGEEPGFSVFPDEYQDIDLMCSHAVSGMMKVRVIKAKNVTAIDKKKQKKISCSIEVDFERKAFTTAKKISKNPTWDEIFEIEIQHGREMSLICYGSKKEFDKPIARVSFYLTPLVRKAQTHQMMIRLLPNGLLFLELEFTEFKTLLQRAPSSKTNGVFGFTLTTTSEQENCIVPHVVRKCVEEIEKRGLDSVGLYRISGNARKKEQLRTQFDEDSYSTDISAENCPDINVITGILKDYLRELPEPLITEKMSQELILGVQHNIQHKDPIMKKKFLSKLLSELPDSYRNTLTFIMNHLCRVINSEGDNKMDCRNLSVCLAPVLQYSPKNLAEPKDLLGLKKYLKAVEVLLELWNEVDQMERETRILYEGPTQTL